ncbi:MULTISPECIES: PA domain-containing protein [Gordonia]|uniref:PA domain-containing protein n=1 Tax=Gordonia TaxID=2053 RepID=UPI0003024D8C|nr:MULTISPECIES: PA domain-containing protein [Gordonia]
MTSEVSPVAAEVVRIAAVSGPSTRDVVLLACWSHESLLFVVFRSLVLPNPDQPVGIVCDLRQLPTEDVEAAAYHVLAFEMVEPHHYPLVLSDKAGAIRWRAALDTELGDQTVGLLETVGTVRDLGEFMSKSTAVKTSIAVAFVASTVLAGCGGTTDAGEVTNGAASPSSSLPAPTKYEYVASDVVAMVDGAPVQLRPFPFSVGAEAVDVRLSAALGDGCSENDSDVEGQFVVLPRGGCTFERKYETAQRAGASGLVITSSDPLPDGRWQIPPIDLTTIPMLVTDDPDSVRRLVDGASVTASFDASVNQTPAE